VFEHENLARRESPLKINELVSAEGIGSALKRTFDDMQVRTSAQ
jgi:hypothetical protein